MALKRLNLHLRDLIDNVEIFTHGHSKIWDRGAKDGEDFEQWIEAIAYEQIPEFRNDKRFWSFVPDMTERRQTKEGRFYRVHFTSGSLRRCCPCR